MVGLRWTWWLLRSFLTWAVLWFHDGSLWSVLSYAARTAGERLQEPEQPPDRAKPYRSETIHVSAAYKGGEKFICPSTMCTMYRDNHLTNQKYMEIRAWTNAEKKEHIKANCKLIMLGEHQNGMPPCKLNFFYTEFLYCVCLLFIKALF